MTFSRRLRRAAQALTVPALGAALTAYFAYNLVIGERGLEAWQRLTRELQTEDARLATLQAERQAIERKVADLSPDHLDPDLLDERVRGTLNLVAPDELVIMREGPSHRSDRAE
jgi:cell division protein FtsB